jgi:NAD+ kinase
MKIALYGKSVSGDNIPYVEKVIEKLRLRRCQILIYKPFYSEIKDMCQLCNDVELFGTHEELIGNADFVFSVGGDGTILNAMTLVRDSEIPILGINLGKLGFLSSISKDEILPAIDLLLNGNYTLDPRTLVRVTNPDKLFGELNYALNELAINRKDSTSLIVIHVYIDDLFLNTYWADGLIIATPTGSTAYSLSSGGPILMPGSENLLITPIAPHNLTVRPIVIPDNSRIKLIVEGRDKQFLVSLDSRSVVVQSHFEMMVERAPFRINLIQMKGKYFFGTIRDKLKWGLDVRN